MVKIPQYESRVLPQTVQTVKQDPVELASAAIGGTEIMQQLAETTQKFYELQTLTQQTKAATDSKIEIATIESEAAVDNNTSKENLDKYRSRIAEVHNKQLSTISDKVARNRTAQSFKIDEYNSYANVVSAFRKKDIQKHKYETLKAAAVNHKAFTFQTDPKEKEKIKQDTLDMIEADRSANFLTAKEAMAARNDVDTWEKDWQDVQIQALVNLDPFVAEKAITSGQFGELTPDDKSNWLNVVDSAKRQQEARKERIIKEHREKKSNSIYQSFFNREVSINDIERELAIPVEEGGLPRQSLIQMRKALYSEQVERVKEIQKTHEGSREYIKLIQQVLETPEDKMRARELVINAYDNGYVDKQEGQVLGQIIDAAKDIQKSKNSNPFMQALNFVRGVEPVSKDAVVEKAADLRRFLLEATQSDEEPQEVAERIANDRYKSNYPEFADWEEGKVYESILGTVKKLGIDKTDGMPIVEIPNAR